MKLDKYTQISTKRGDKGKSTNYSNEVFDKDDILFDTVGTIDELSSLLGVIYHHVDIKEEIKTIQRVLQNINSLVATTKEEMIKKIPEVKVSDVTYLETLEQSALDNKTIERFFVLPGSEGDLASAYLHLARTVTRRAERTLLRFIKTYQRENLDVSLSYLNRLSDLLFILASE